jgi:adenylyl-sulfate kinase
VVRTNLSAGLGFSKEDRDTNVRRIGWVCELLNRHGVDAVVAAISPYRDARNAVRARVPRFIEVYAACPLDVLTARDPKGLYKKALAGEIAHFTGVSDPYEPPLDPEVLCPTDRESPAESAERVLSLLAARSLTSVV